MKYILVQYAHFLVIRRGNHFVCQEYSKTGIHVAHLIVQNFRHDSTTLFSGEFDVQVTVHRDKFL